MVGGGIRTSADAANVAKAGADIVVTGTAAEKSLDKLSDIIRGVKRL
ncbi:MAG: HisA/HisF-related TIM barrel protein [Candidatus Caldarchaeum sp.]|nr:HisA/HisF-related TIM barrel protein [Candidatus Caldarchaeum sp.]